VETTTAAAAAEPVKQDSGSGAFIGNFAFCLASSSFHHVEYKHHW